MISLNDDVLFYIFSYNTLEDRAFWELERDFFHSPPPIDSIVTARHTSQVCLKWRTIMLSSPSIWATSLNLDYLGQKNGQWRRLIMTRIGTAKISILGSKLRKGMPETEFLFTLLQDYWPRIRKVSVLVRGTKLGNDPRWGAFQCHAPNLELLNLHFPPSSNLSFGGNFTALPAVSILSVLILEYTELNFVGMELSHLTFLELTECTIRGDFLPALSQMSILGTLIINSGSSDIDITSNHILQPVIFPKLQFVDLKMHLRDIIRIISYIVCNAECVMELEDQREHLTSSVSTQISEDEIYMLENALKKHLQSGLTSCIDLSACNNFLSFSFRFQPSPEGPPKFGLLVRPGSESISRWNRICDAVFNALFSCDFRKVTDLSIIMYDSVILSYPLMRDLLITFSSINTIFYTTEETIRTLTTIQKNGRDIKLLPLLEEIYIYQPSKAQYEAVLNFNAIRRREALPTVVLRTFEQASQSEHA